MAYHGNPFSEAEDEIIRAGYASGDTLQRISSRIGRSLPSVGSRAQLLGIRHPAGTRNGAARLKPELLAFYESPAFPTLPFVPHIIVTGKYQMARSA